MAVYVKLAGLPHTFPAMLFGFTVRSTPVTLNGTGVAPVVEPGPLPVVVELVTLLVVVEPGPLLVGVELDTLPGLLPHAAKLKIARQMKTKPINGRFNINFPSQKLYIQIRLSRDHDTPTFFVLEAMYSHTKCEPAHTSGLLELSHHSLCLLI